MVLFAVGTVAADDDKDLYAILEITVCLFIFFPSKGTL